MTEAERLAQALENMIPREWTHVRAAGELLSLQAEVEALRADAKRAKAIGDLLCELIEHPAAGPFTDNIDSDLLHRWQDACDAAIDAARKT